MIRASFPGMSLWNDLERFWRNIVGDSDYEDDEIDPDAYVVPEFAKWDKTRNVRQTCIFRASWTHKSAWWIQ